MEGSNQALEQPSNPPVPNSTTDQHTSAWVIILFLLFFPPLAIYFMYKDEKYNSWLPNTIIIIGILSFILNMTLVIFVIPQLTLLYSNLTLPYPTINIYSQPLLILFPITIIVFAFVARNKIKNRVLGVKNWVNASVIILVISYFALSIVPMISVIQPIYNLISQIDNSTNENTSTPTPTVSPISDWKTFKADEFMFKYPNNWGEPKYGQSSDFVIGTVGNFNGRQEVQQVGVLRYADEATEEYIDFINSMASEGAKLTLDGQPAARNVDNNQKTVSVHVLSPGKKTVFAINLRDRNYDLVQTSQLFDQILSTFKFTDQGKIKLQSRFDGFSMRTSNTSVQLLVTDSNGLQTGYLPDKKTIIKDIPALYGKEVGIGDASNPNNQSPDTMIFSMNNLLSGIYKVEVIGVKNDNYKVYVNLITPNGENGVQKVLEGYTQEGKVNTFYVDTTTGSISELQ